jgi:hypothetical protein
VQYLYPVFQFTGKRILGLPVYALKDNEHGELWEGFEMKPEAGLGFRRQLQFRCADPSQQDEQQS